MCGVVGIVAQQSVNQELFDALTVLQHRGQDAAGIVTCEGDRLHLRKNNGMVRDVFRTRHMRRLKGNIGIGHVRYPTAGTSSSAEAQPFYVNSPYGITLAHNGNLTNVDEIRDDLYRTDLRHMNTNSDSEVLLNVFAHELQRQVQGQLSPEPAMIFNAVTALHKRCRGAYAVVSMITGYGLVAFRDPHGVRPLVYGTRVADNGKTEYAVASESVALQTLGFHLVRDLAPGEAIFIDQHGEFHSQQCVDSPMLAPCLFEYVYLARPDSILDGVSVYKARLRQGITLAQKINRIWPNHDIDVVMPIPDTSRTAALELASILNLKLREGFIKNRYIGRTFIMPGQQERKRSVRQKLNPIVQEFEGMNVLLVDDSIVRGTTCKQIIQMARESGAKKVYFASAAPPVQFPNVYGIDMPAVTELFAHKRNVEQICEMIGADGLVYQDLDDLVKAVQADNPSIKQFDTSVFDGCYITGDIDEAYLDRIAQLRSDEAKHQSESNASIKHVSVTQTLDDDDDDEGSLDISNG